MQLDSQAHSTSDGEALQTYIVIRTMWLVIEISLHRARLILHNATTFNNCLCFTLLVKNLAILEFVELVELKTEPKIQS